MMFVAGIAFTLTALMVFDSLLDFYVPFMEEDDEYNS